VNANQMILKTWLSQANYVMDKSGMDAGKFLSTYLSILGSMISPLR
jgi:hypothetical protein